MMMLMVNILISEINVIIGNRFERKSIELLNES